LKIAPASLTSVYQGVNVVVVTVSSAEQCGVSLARLVTDAGVVVDNLAQEAGVIATQAVAAANDGEVQGILSSALFEANLIRTERVYTRCATVKTGSECREIFVRPVSTYVFISGVTRIYITRHAYRRGQIVVRQVELVEVENLGAADLEATNVREAVDVAVTVDVSATPTGRGRHRDGGVGNINRVTSVAVSICLP